MAYAEKILIDHDGKITDERGHVCGLITFPDDAKGILGRSLVTGEWANINDVRISASKKLTNAQEALQGAVEDLHDAIEEVAK